MRDAALVSDDARWVGSMPEMYDHDRVDAQHLTMPDAAFDLIVVSLASCSPRIDARPIPRRLG
jgi:hypothetical protein